MITEQIEDRLPAEFPWHWKCILASVLITLSLLWFVKDPSYESGISLFSSAVILVGLMITGGRLGVALAGGFFLGAILSPFAIYKLYAEPALSELRAKNDADNSRLTRQNTELIESLKEMSKNQMLIEASLRNMGELRDAKSNMSQASGAVERIGEPVLTRERFLPEALDGQPCDE